MNTNTIFICGPGAAALMEERCADCSSEPEYLCDYPVGDGQTCDRKICPAHATVIAIGTHQHTGIHYCLPHSSTPNLPRHQPGE